MTKNELVEIVGKIEANQREIARFKERFDDDTEDLRSRNKWLYKLAAEQGCDAKALRTVIKVRAIEHEIEKQSSGAAYEQIRLHLGDLAGTPLGNFAEQKAIEGNGKRRGRPPKEEVERVPTVAPHAYASDVTG